MTDSLALTPAVFVAPTPAGALHVVTDDADGPAERLIRAVLRAEYPVITDNMDLIGWTGTRTRGEALQVIAATQERGWIEGRDERIQLPQGPLGQTLPGLLAPLSDAGQAALIDDQGFPLASVGLAAGVEIELSTLAAEIARLGQRRAAASTSSGGATGWAIIDRFGASTTGFFPLSIGAQQFVLTIGGTPRLHHPSLVKLVAALSMRYATTAAAGSSSTPTPTPNPSPGGKSHA